MTSANKIVLHKAFRETIESLKDIGIRLPPDFSDSEMDFSAYVFPPNGDVVQSIEEIKGYKLNPKNGELISKQNSLFCAYDESLKKFSSLEGTAVSISHSLIVQNQTEYIPQVLLTFNFYTRARKYIESNDFIKYSIDHDTDSKKDYISDRNLFLLENVPADSLLLIDGPLIGGQVSSSAVTLNEGLLEKNIIPLFFVKNSASDLVISYVPALENRYNSDLHWAYSTLKVGERSSFFRYFDSTSGRAKIFCYLKPFNSSPQRVEMHEDTFIRNEGKIKEILDLVYYLLLVQGNMKNPQVRLIAIAEMYARQALKLVDIDSMMQNSGIVPTINQERFW